MSGFLDDQTIAIPCENCSRKTDKTIGWLKTHSKFTCSCGTVINLDVADLRRKIDEVERMLSNFTKGS